MIHNHIHFEDPSKVWATSDYHFGHKNIIKYDNRPFKDLDEMREEIILRHNSVVAPDEFVIFHGDFCLGGLPPEDQVSILDRMNGTFYLIRGNHDKVFWNDLVLGRHPRRYFDVLNITFGASKKKISAGVVASHCKFFVWPDSHKGCIHTFGHSHGSIPENLITDRSMDVGINTNNYYPYNYLDIIKMLKKKVVHTVDHHIRGVN